MISSHDTVKLTTRSIPHSFSIMGSDREPFDELRALFLAGKGQEPLCRRMISRARPRMVFRRERTLDRCLREHVSSARGRLRMGTCLPTTARRPKSSRSASTSSPAHIRGGRRPPVPHPDHFRHFLRHPPCLARHRPDALHRPAAQHEHQRDALDAAERVGQPRHTDLDGLVTTLNMTHTACVWHYREQLRDILTFKQRYVTHLLVNLRTTTCCTKKKDEPLTEIVEMIRNDLGGILARMTSRETNRLLEAANWLFQAATGRPREPSARRAGTVVSPPTASSIL